MLGRADQTKLPTAIRVDLGAIFISLELSRSTWLVTSLSPGGGEKVSRHTVSAGDITALFARFGVLREKARVRTGKLHRLVVMQEAVLDGFWIDRVLQREAWLESHIVDAASIAVSRRRRAATACEVDQAWGASRVTQPGSDRGSATKEMFLC